MYLHILLIHCKKSCLPKLKEVFQFVWSLQALVCKKILLKLEFTEAFLSLFYKKKIKKRFPPVGCMVWLLQVCVVGVNVFLQFLNFEVLVPLPNFLNELFSSKKRFRRNVFKLTSLLILSRSSCSHHSTRDSWTE